MLRDDQFEQALGAAERNLRGDPGAKRTATKLLTIGESESSGGRGARLSRSLKLGDMTPTAGDRDQRRHANHVALSHSKKRERSDADAHEVVMCNGEGGGGGGREEG